MNIPSAWRLHRDILVLDLALLLLASVVGTRARALHYNVLLQHPEWISTKPSLARAVMGAGYFRGELQGLDRNRLHLDAWFGFQEVTFHRPVRLDALHASFAVQPGGYLDLRFGGDSSQFSVLRISSRADLPSGLFRTSRDGEFLSRDPLALREPIQSDVPHRIGVEFEATSSRIVLDGREIGTADPVPGAQVVGFRGGERGVWVDDLELAQRGEASIREDFVYRRGGFLKVVALWLLLITVVATGAFVGIRVRHIGHRTAGLWATLASLGLLGCSIAAYGYFYFIPKRYPYESGEAKRAEASRISAAQFTLIQELRHRYPTPASGRRILFLGSSQTWGAGASNPDDVWVSVLQRHMQAANPEVPLECINAGISGLTASEILQSLDSLLLLRPMAVVIDLSNNDTDPARFRAALDTMVVRIQASGARPVLLREPNSLEHRAQDSHLGNLDAKHRIMDEVGARHAAPVIDLQRVLDRRAQDGWLWWDFVHLTSFGQRLMANYLAAQLPAALDWEPKQHRSTGAAFPAPSTRVRPSPSDLSILATVYRETPP